ncbi:MAG: serine acetyltransferase [Desulfovibrionaceae bacterium]|nr:serine acetyltransferase [Desulfovibrionaceae bacterium]
MIPKLIPLSRTSMPPLDSVVEELCSTQSLRPVLHQTLHNAPMPSLESLQEIMSRLKAVLFPGYFGVSDIHVESIRYHMSANLDSIYRKLAEQIRRGGCFAQAEYAGECSCCEKLSAEKAMAFMKKLPEIRRMLVSDAKAGYEGDPAASSAGETIFCYPSMRAMTHHRIAHELYLLDVPVIPRIISEMAHSETGIDINPGATIGEEFFIDHGTGTVIGETAIIGRGCRLYQGVTLGALSFPKDSDGMLVKGIPRHPILEDNVTVYSGATILGRVTIGAGSIIGGNVWVSHDVPPGSKLVQQTASNTQTGTLIGKA